MLAFEAVIGLEVHAELLTESKIFCEASAHFGGAPNTHVGPVSLGMPGTLPVLNKKVLDMAILAGLATNCQIPRHSKFDRKHYFYPDLPKGYQITQYDQPIAEFGWVDIQTEQGSKRIRLCRIHMEEDAGKLVHAGAERLAGSHYSLVDFNRAGVPLLEIVSEPDLSNSAEARAYLEELRSIIMAIGVCDGKMEEGSLRCDANISVRLRGTTELGTRVEIKNINSFRFLQRAIDYEIQRQITTIQMGETIHQETRLWDENRGMTVTMRSKEDAHDYRYFPDPDLVLLNIPVEWVQESRANMPELPAAKRQRYQEQLGLSTEEAYKLVAEKEFALFFEQTLPHILTEPHGTTPTSTQQPKIAANWLLGDIAAYLNEQRVTLAETQLSPQKLGEMLLLIANGTISGKIAKTLLAKLLETPQHAQQLVQEMGLTQISDQSELREVIGQLLAKHPKEMERYWNGEDKLLGFFVGQVMKETKGRAAPGLANELVKEKLAELKGS